MRLVHDEPPRDVIWREVGPLDKIHPIHSQVLLALYIRPATRTTGGIEIPETAVDEDRYQGRVGLVLKLGPRAFVDEGGAAFHGFAAKPGDWVVYRPSDGMRFQIGKRDCRLIPDVGVKMILDEPDEVY
jgi:co-chaperonin GroES (HSP10)